MANLQKSKIKPTPLLHAIPTKTPLDLVIERLFFVIPLSREGMEWLNTIIYQDEVFWINYWSLTHTLLGMVYGIFHLLWPETWTIWNYLVLHTLFELWELWAGGYLTGESKLIYQEIVDLVMDTIFGLLGVYIVKFLFRNLV